MSLNLNCNFYLHIHSGYIQWYYCLYYNHKFFPSSQNIEEHISYRDWKDLSTDTSLPWSEILIDKYVDKWNWGYDGLSSNISLPWSEHFIERYIEKWNWNSLFSNEGIRWSLNLLFKYIKYYNNQDVSINVWNVLKPYVDDIFIEEILQSNNE